MSKKKVDFFPINEVRQVPRKSPNRATRPSAENRAVAASLRPSNLEQARKMAANLARQVAQNGGSPTVYYSPGSNFSPSPPRPARATSASVGRRRAKSVSVGRRATRSVAVGTGNNGTAAFTPFTGKSSKTRPLWIAAVSKAVHATKTKAKEMARNAMIIGLAVQGVKSARQKYVEEALAYEKEMKKAKSNARQQAIIHDIVSGWINKATSEPKREEFKAKQAAALRKLKNNLKANRELLSNKYRVKYNKHASQLIRDLFPPLFAREYLPGGNREAYESMERHARAAIKALFNLDAKEKDEAVAREAAEAARRARMEANPRVVAFRQQQALLRAMYKQANNARQLARSVATAQRNESLLRQARRTHPGAAKYLAVPEGVSRRYPKTNGKLKSN